MTRYTTIKEFASRTGYSEAAIRSKISRGSWPKNDVWIRAPDNGLLIDLDGFKRWALGRSVGTHPKRTSARSRKTTGGEERE